MHIQDHFKVWLTVLAGKVVVETETLVGVGMDRHEQAEEIAEPTNLERQVGRAIGVGPAGGGGGAPVGGEGDPAPPGEEATLDCLAEEENQEAEDVFGPCGQNWRTM